MRLIKKLPLILCLLGLSIFLTAQSSSLKKITPIKTYHLRMASFETDYGNTFTDRDVWIKLTSYLRLPERGDLIVQVMMEEGLGLESIVSKPTKNGNNYYNEITYLTPTYTAVIKNRYGHTIWEKSYASQQLIHNYEVNGQLSEAELILNWENKSGNELKRLEKESLDFKQLEIDLNDLLSGNQPASTLAQTNKIIPSPPKQEITPKATTEFVTPENNQPAITEFVTPEHSQPETTEFVAPENNQPVTTEFVAPENNQPETTEFVAPEHSQPETTEFVAPEHSQPETTEFVAPEHSQPETTEFVAPEHSQPETTEFVVPEHSQPETTEFVTPENSPVENTPIEYDNNRTDDNNGFYTAPDTNPAEGTTTSSAYDVDDATNNTTPVINNSRLGLVIGGGQMPLNLSRGNIQTFIIDDSPSMDEFSSNVFIESDDDIYFLRLGLMGDNSDINRTFGLFFDIGLGTQGVSKFEFEYNYGWQIGKGWFRVSPQLGFVAGNSNIQLGEMFQNDLFIEIGDTKFFSDAVKISYRNLYLGASGRMNVNLSLGKKFGLSLYGGYTRGFSLSERIKFKGDDEEGLPTKAIRTLPNNRTSFLINNDDSNSEKLFDFSGIKMGASFIYYLGN